MIKTFGETKDPNRLHNYQRIEIVEIDKERYVRKKRSKKVFYKGVCNVLKVRLKYNRKDMWIDPSWIWYVSQYEDSGDTIIESKHGGVLHVEETVEEILEAIKYVTGRGVVE